MDYSIAAVDTVVSEPPKTATRVEVMSSSTDWTLCRMLLVLGASAVPRKTKSTIIWLLDLLLRSKPDAAFNCSLDWWHANAAKHPAVAQVAKRHLDSPASSIPS